MKATALTQLLALSPHSSLIPTSKVEIPAPVLPDLSLYSYGITVVFYQTRPVMDVDRPSCVDLVLYIVGRYLPICTCVYIFNQGKIVRHCKRRLIPSIVAYLSFSMNYRFILSSAGICTTPVCVVQSMQM